MVNKAVPEAKQLWTLKHELSHILLGHLDDDRTKDSKTYLDNIDSVEEEANRYADQMTDEEFAELMTYQIGAAVYM